MEFFFFNVVGLSSYKDIFWGILWNFLKILSAEQLWINTPKLFNIISWNFPIIHFSCLKPFAAHLSFVKG